MAGSTISDLVLLANAGISSNVIAGDTLLKVSGIGDGFNFNRSGSLGSLITIKPYTINAITDGRIVINGDYVRLEGIDNYYSGWTERYSLSYDASGIKDDMQFTIMGKNIELYRCKFHDLVTAGFWVAAETTTITECISYHNGYIDLRRAHGHGLYVQNLTGIKTFERCIIFSNFSMGVKLFGNGVWHDVVFKDCIFFNTGNLNSYSPDPSLPVNSLGVDALWGGEDVLVDKPCYNIEFDGCEFYRSSSEIGTNNACMIAGYNYGAHDFKLTNNYMIANRPFWYLAAAGFPLWNMSDYDISGNTFLGTLEGVTEEQIPGNTFGERPTSGKRVRLIDCGDGIRGHLVIYNYDLDNTVDVDCSALLAEGDDYRLTNVQDFTDIITGVAGAGGVITVPMTGRTIAAPIKWQAPPTSFPEFGCFIIEKVV